MNLLKTGILTVLLVASFSFQSCESDDLENNTTEKTQKNTETEGLIDFKGLPVKHRFSTPVDELTTEHTDDNLKQFYNKKRQEVFAERGMAGRFTESELPNPEIILEAAEKVLSDFPYNYMTLEDMKKHAKSIDINEISASRNYNKKASEEINIDMIKKDFPTLTEQQINNNIETIDEYYAQNLDYEVLSEIANTNSTENNLNKSNRSIDEGLERVKCIINNLKYPHDYIRNSIATTSAIIGSIAYSESLYDRYDDNNTKKDAFRHVTFSAFLCHFYLTLSSKHPRLLFAEDAGNSNEICGGNEIDGMYMDFHNNHIGRQVWNFSTGYSTTLGVTTGLALPPVEMLVIQAIILTNNGKFIDKNSFFPENQRTNLTTQAILATNSNTVVYFSNKTK
ncbi:MAG: hypothetical protein H6584_02090 [Flavobacteriales bacterium]|nr:hypothetical protein [Flavobacteriales bacterium]